MVQKALSMELGKVGDLEAMKVAELEALIAANQDAGNVSEAPKAKAKESDVLGSDPRTGKTIEIQIENGEGEAGRSDVFGSVNGHTFNIKRGVKVTCDRWIYDHLRSVIPEVEVQKFDDSGKPIGTEITRIPRYNISRFD